MAAELPAVGDYGAPPRADVGGNKPHVKFQTMPLEHTSPSICGAEKRVNKLANVITHYICTTTLRIYTIP